jgi:uncharacterized membrane protein YedE/YeeE
LLKNIFGGKKMSFAILAGLIVGIIFGFALQRGRFCMNSAIRDSILLQDMTLAKSVGVAVLVSMFGFAILDAVGWIAINPKPLFWGANLVGGIIFGIGMVLAGGCASGITYRVGEGMVGAFSALIGLAAAGTITAMGFLAPVKDYLQTNTKVMVDDAAPTLSNIFGVSYTVLAIGISVIAAVVWYLIAQKNQDEDEVDKSVPLTQRIFKKGWGWLATGIAIGLINVLAFYSSTQAGRGYALAITSGWIGIVKVGILRIAEATLGWDAYLVIGIIVGALIASLIAGEFKLRWPGWGMIIQTLIGGLLMGFGAVVSAGCNVTHILSGLPQLSIGSLLGSISIVIGAWIAAYVMFIRPQKS